MKGRNQSSKLCISLGLLLLAAAAYTLYWVQSRGAFGTSPIEIPVHLDEHSSLSVSFSVFEKGDHYIEMQYPRAATYDVRRQLDAITGKATVTSRGGRVAEANLPVGRQTGNQRFGAMVLFALAMEPHKDYRFLLEVAHLPPALKQARPTIKVYMDPHYNLIFPQIELLGVLLVVVALLCLLSGIRRQAWHLKTPFLIMLVASLGTSILGYVGLILIRPGPFAGWRWTIVQICFLLIVIGPVAFVLSIVSWFVASFIAYFRSRSPKSLL